MNWRGWRKRMNAIPITTKDVLVPGQKLIIDTQRGITFEAKFQEKYGNNIIIKTFYPKKEKRTLYLNEIAYRLITERDRRRAKEALEALKALLLGKSQSVSIETSTP